MEGVESPPNWIFTAGVLPRFRVIFHLCLHAWIVRISNANRSPEMEQVRPKVSKSTLLHSTCYILLYIPLLFLHSTTCFALIWMCLRSHHPSMKILTWVTSCYDSIFESRPCLKSIECILNTGRFLAIDSGHKKVQYVQFPVQTWITAIPVSSPHFAERTVVWREGGWEYVALCLHGKATECR